MTISIIDIGLNDDLQTTIRKINSNFSNIASAASSEAIVSSAAEESSEKAAKQIIVLTGQINELRTWVNTQLTTLNNRVNHLSEQVSLVSPPPVGIYIQSDFDPSNQYPVTTWEKVTPAPIPGINTWHRIA